MVREVGLRWYPWVTSLTIGARFNNPNMIIAQREPVDRFLIESPHTVEECKRVVKNVYASGYLNNFDWGCKDGVHTGWVIIEAESGSQALWVVPPFLRSKARAVRLVKYDPEMVEDGLNPQAKGTG